MPKLNAHFQLTCAVVTFIVISSILALPSCVACKTVRVSYMSYSADSALYVQLYSTQKWFGYTNKTSGFAEKKFGFTF